MQIVEAENIQLAVHLVEQIQPRLAFVDVVLGDESGIECARRIKATSVSGASVTFEPGARSAWHTHPCGQTLIVTAGLGWTQCEGEPREEIRPGDVITCPLGRKHWHGATATTAVTHIAIQEADANGSVVEWLQQVTDDEYLGVAADAG